MAQVNISRPAVVSPVGGTGQPPVRSYLPGSHINDGDFVVLNANQTISTATANPAAILGVAAHDSLANYAGTTSGPAPLQNVLGTSQVGSPLVPGSPANTLVGIPDLPNLVEINLTVTTTFVAAPNTPGAGQAGIGTQVGLAIDPSSGFFVADPTASNKVATIVRKLGGPAFGASGDLGGRVSIQFLPSALQG